jgi:hypothetical protein
MDEKKQPPVIDLHESEWRRAGKYEPIFGPNAKGFLIYTVCGIVSWLIASNVIGLIRASLQ